MSSPHVLTVTLAAPAAPAVGQPLDILALVLNATGAVLVVLFILISMSVIAWFIIGVKFLYFRRAEGQTRRFVDDIFYKARRLDTVYTETEQLSHSPVAQMFRAGYVELTRLKRQRQQDADAGAAGGAFFDSGDDIENVERSLRRAFLDETTHMESLLPFLATTGSAAPFIGLFGTVWGIMNSFRAIAAKGSANLATVAPGMAEALITTAIGLVAAIPAVMAYNYFARKTKVLSAEMESFSNDFLNLVKRHILR